MHAKAQTDTALQTVQQFPEKYLSSVSEKLSDVDKKLSRQTLKALHKFEKQENRIKGKLGSKDSLMVKDVFANSEQKLTQLQNDFTNMPDKAIDKINGEYNAYLDTLQSTFKFLQQKGNKVIDKSKALTDKLGGATNKLNVLEGKLQKADEIKKYLRERREIIKQQLEKFGMVKQLKQLDKSVYYYGQYVTEYKAMLKDKKKIEQKAMSLLYKIPAFKKFVSQNSFFSSLFPQGSPAGNMSVAQLTQGLQSRVNVQNYMQQNMAAGGPNVGQMISQQLTAANGELTKLKEKITKYGGDGEEPTFKANTLKTKSFLKRIEYGANIQFSKSSNYFPNSSDIAFSLGYKLNDKSSLGVGGSYKLGLGTGINNIKLSNQGMGVRSYIDWKLKAQFYISGGYEQNYFTSINNNSLLNSGSPWTSSALIGLSKKYQATKKYKGKIQILYDFLSNTHFPRTQAFIFRTGINFK